MAENTNNGNKGPDWFVRTLIATLCGLICWLWLDMNSRLCRLERNQVLILINLGLTPLADDGENDNLSRTEFADCSYNVTGFEADYLAYKTEQSLRYWPSCFESVRGSRPARDIE
ncbi:MAG: hypothetical protein WC374_01055 [Phycisphaerae bacterium]|jgi:hypothetical protein